jgi:hypothetical protein
MNECRRSENALVSVPRFVQQPLQPHILSKCAEFRLMRARSSVNARRAVAARSRNTIAVSASPMSACAAAA